MSAFITSLLFLLFIILAVLVAYTCSRAAKAVRAVGGSGPRPPARIYSKKLIDSIAADIKENIYKTKWFGPEREDDVAFLKDLTVVKQSRGTPYERPTYERPLHMSAVHMPTYNALVTMRRAELAYISRKSGIKAMQLAPEFVKEWNKSQTVDTILGLSKRYFIPPTTIVKQLMEEHVSNPPSDSIIAQIGKSDLSSRYWNELTQTKAIAFEDKVGELLDAAGIQYLTEYDQRQDPTLAKRTLPRGCKATTATPDFLLIHPIKLNDGRKIHWIDAKDYIGWESKLLYKKLKKQAAKYNDAFGWGAFVFSEGYCTDLNLGATLLDVVQLTTS
jgi:hypothetical protein